MAIKRIILDVLMVDGTEHHDVVVTMKDRYRGEQTGRRQKWGTFEEAQQTYITFWAYSALVRLGKLPVATTFDAFLDLIEQIDEHEADEDGTDVDPTATTALTD